MGEQRPQRLTDYLFDRLCAGQTISADLVTISANYGVIPDIPLSDYHAAVEVMPDMDWEWVSVCGQFRVLRHLETLRGFRVLYQEVPEQYLPYGQDYDHHATVREMTQAETRQELEVVLSRCVKDFGLFRVGSARYYLP